MDCRSPALFLEQLGPQLLSPLIQQVQKLTPRPLNKCRISVGYENNGVAPSAAPANLKSFPGSFGTRELADMAS